MRVLYATDGSEGAANAGRFLAGLLRRTDLDLTAMTVVADDRHAAQAGETLAAGVKALGSTAEKVLRLTRCGHPAEEIVRAAAEVSADVVVLGSHGRSAVIRFLLGSVAEQVSRHAPCPVLLVRGSGEELQRLVVGVDGSECAAHAATWLRAFLLPPDCELRLVTVLPNLHEMAREHVLVVPPLAAESTPLDQWQRDQALKRLKVLSQALEGEKRQVVTEIRSGDAASALLDVAADEGTDLLVVGSHGQGRLERFLLGSVSQQVLRHAPCSVLVVRNAPSA